MSKHTKMQRQLVALILICCFGCTASVSRAAGPARAAFRDAEKSLERDMQRRAYRVRAFDYYRDRASGLSVLKRARSVDRYTRISRARSELRWGLPAYRHMSSISSRRPLTARSARLRFGLPRKPNAVERIRIPRGTRLHFNKVLGGKPGFGEITLSSRLPKSAIRKVLTLRP